jgi:hypothetical protein
VSLAADFHIFKPYKKCLGRPSPYFLKLGVKIHLPKGVDFQAMAAIVQEW